MSLPPPTPWLLVLVFASTLQAALFLTCATATAHSLALGCSMTYFSNREPSGLANVRSTRAPTFVSSDDMGAGNAPRQQRHRACGAPEKTWYGGVWGSCKFGTAQLVSLHYTLAKINVKCINVRHAINYCS